jgi:zinc transporter ZupT
MAIERYKIDKGVMKSEIYTAVTVIYFLSAAFFGLVAADIGHGEHKHCNHQHPKHHEVRRATIVGLLMLCFYVANYVNTLYSWWE